MLFLTGDVSFFLFFVFCFLSFDLETTYATDGIGALLFFTQQTLCHSVLMYL